MITSKIKRRHWLFFAILVAGLILSLVGLALSIGERYDIVAEEFRLVFYLSVFGTIIFAILLAVGIMYFEKARRPQKS